MPKDRDYTIQRASQNLNNRTFLDIFLRLKNLALTRFQWKNLPPTCDERWLEQCLFEKGYCLFFNEPDVGFLNLNVTLTGNYDVYNVPMNRRAYSTKNGFQAFRGPLDSVVIFNNYEWTPTFPTIELYALLLYEIRRAIDVNVKQQKTPILLKSSQKQRLTLKNLYMAYDGNEPFIFGDDKMNLNEAIEAIKTDAPYVADKLKILYNNVWNEALTFLGIENSNQDKRERLVAEEIGGNDGNIEAQREVFLTARQQAADKINAMFGLSIEPVYRSNLDTKVNRASLNFPIGMDLKGSSALFEEGDDMLE